MATVIYLQYILSLSCKHCRKVKLWENFSSSLPDLAGITVKWKGSHNNNYYSFKIFPHFWLVKTTRIIHHNQLLLTKFGKSLRHIESMKSKVQPAESCWTDKVKMTLKVQPTAHYWTVNQENLGTKLCYSWWTEKQRAK